MSPSRVATPLGVLGGLLANRYQRSFPSSDEPVPILAIKMTSDGVDTEGVASAAVAVSGGGGGGTGLPLSCRRPGSARGHSAFVVTTPRPAAHSGGPPPST